MSGSSSSGSPVLDQISSALNEGYQTQGKQVGIGAGAFAALALFTLFSFNLLRPNNKIVYAPKVKYADNEKVPPKVGDGFMDWVTPLRKYKEADLLPLIGMDAVVFLRFLRMIRNLTVVLALAMSIVLIPLDVTYNISNPGKTSSALLSLTMASVDDGRIWAHVAMSYVGTFIALYFIWVNYKHVLRLRWAWFRSEDYQKSFHARTLMITRVSKRLQSDNALAGVLADIKMPYPTTEVHIGREVGTLPDLIERHDNLVRQLEKVLAKYLKDPNNVPASRPSLRIGGCLGCGGQKVDAIDYLTNQINKVETAVEHTREQIAQKKPQSYGFASMAAVPYAHAAARSLRNKHPRNLKIELAPLPRDILWNNLILTKGQRFRSSAVGFLLLSLLMFINAVPLLAVALISQMSAFVGYLPFLKAFQNWNSYVFSAVAGLLPPAISGLFGWMLPILMRKLGKYRGETTKTGLDRVILSQYFTFLLISQIVIFTLVGVAITTIGGIIGQVQHHQSFKEIISSLGGNDKLLGLIKYQYFAMSIYWLTWVPLRGYLFVFDLAQALKLLLVWVQKAFFGRTPRDVREYTKPPSFDYSVYYANLLFLFAVAMLYATLAPLVLVFAAFAFIISGFVYKYQLMFVCTTKNESGGRLWRPVVNRLLVCVVLMQLILALAVALTATYLKAIVSLPPIIIVIAFKLYLRKAFDDKFNWYIPQDSEIAESHVYSGDVRHNRLQRRFGHPSLHQPLFTPMVHAKVRHLLPQVYRGRLDNLSTQVVDGRKVETEEVEGGMRIAVIEEDQLEYDPHNDSDNRSIMSGTTLATFQASPGIGGSPRTDPFQKQYNNYLQGGPSRQGTVDDYEMGDVGRQVYNQPDGSRDNLLDRSAQPMSMYSDHTLIGSGGHGRQGSDALKKQGFQPGQILSSPRTTPGFEGPAVGGYFGAPVQPQTQSFGQHHAQRSATGFSDFSAAGPPVSHHQQRTGGGYSDFQAAPPVLHSSVSQQSLASMGAGQLYESPPTQHQHFHSASQQYSATPSPYVQQAAPPAQFEQYSPPSRGYSSSPRPFGHSQQGSGGSYQQQPPQSQYRPYPPPPR